MRLRDFRQPGLASVFVTGIAGLSIEILAGRLMMPVFGSSLYQWSTLIGCILAAYTLGYLFSDYLSEQRLPGLIAFCGLYCLLIPLCAPSALMVLVRLPLFLAMLAISILIAGIPCLLMASILPFFQRKARRRHLGLFLASSALGNLFGIWLVAFWLVPSIGVRESFLTIGTVSVIWGLLLVWRLLRPSKRAAVALFVLAGAFMVHALSLAYSPKRSFLKRHPELKSDGLLVRSTEQGDYAISFTNPARFFFQTLQQYSWDGDRVYAHGYFKLMPVVSGWLPSGGARSIFLIGLEGGAIPWEIEQHNHDTRITAAEIDAQWLTIAEKDLPVSRLRHTKVLLKDGRLALISSKSKFDLIMLDAYRWLSIPSHLVTVEFFDEVADKLNPEGLLAINVCCGIFDRLRQSILAGLSSRFQSIASIPLGEGAIVIASPKKRDFVETIRRSARGASADWKRSDLGILDSLKIWPRMSRSEVSEFAFKDDSVDIDPALYRLTAQFYESHLTELGW